MLDTYIEEIDNTLELLEECSFMLSYIDIDIRTELEHIIDASTDELVRYSENVMSMNYAKCIEIKRMATNLQVMLRKEYERIGG